MENDKKRRMIRCHVLDKCFQYPGCTMKELVEACANEMIERTGSDAGVSKRTIQNDIKFMKSNDGWNIELETITVGEYDCNKQDTCTKTAYRYQDRSFSIMKMPLKAYELEQFKDTIEILSRYKDLPQYSWLDEVLPKLEDNFDAYDINKSVVGLDQNPDLVGRDFLTDIHEAILKQETLNINYTLYNGVVRTWIIHPYYLKQYNNRWFLFGLNDAFKDAPNIYKRITNIPLDRITSCEKGSTPYIENTDYDFNGWFEDIIGVSFPKLKKGEEMNGKIEEITLQFTPDRYPYVKTKPIHGTQHNYDDLCQVKISVVPNNELEQQIFSFGPDVKVISPAWLKDKMKENLKKAVGLYEIDEKE